MCSFHVTHKVFPVQTIEPGQAADLAVAHLQGPGGDGQHSLVAWRHGEGPGVVRSSHPGTKDEVTVSTQSSREPWVSCRVR